MIKITDADKDLNSKNQFRIQINELWHDVDSKDFFDYLYQTNKIDGHDSEAGIAWIEHTDMNYNHHTQEFEEVYRGESHSYQWWIEHLIDDDEVLLQYMQTIEIVMAQAA